MSEDNSSFQEVVSLQINVDSFASDLKQVESLWDSTLSRLSASAQDVGIDPSALVNTKGLQDDFIELAAQVSQLQFTLTDAFSGMANSVNAELASIDASVLRTEEHLEGLNKTRAASAGSAQRPVVDREAIPASTPTSQSGGGGFFGDVAAGFSSGQQSMGSMLGMLAQFQILWGAISIAVQGVVSAIMTIPNAIKQGIEYTAQFQQSVTDLQGVLAGNIQFSKDFTENMKLAGESAKFAAAGLQDNAAKFNLDPKQLQNAFKANVDSGAGSMVRDTKELVDLTTEFAIAMKAAGKSTEGTRSLVSEIPKLLQGTEAPSSKLLETLGMSRDKWESVRQEALQHKNLIELLAPTMAPYIAAMSEAQDKHAVLLAQLDLAKNRIDSAFAAPVLTEWDMLLGQIEGSLNKNRNAVELFGNSVGGTTAAVLSLTEVFSLFGGKSHPILGTLSAVFDALAISITSVKNTLMDLGYSLEQIFKAMAHPTTGGFKEALANIKTYAEQSNADLQRITQESAARQKALWSGDDSTKAVDATTGGKNLPTTGAKPPRPVDHSKEQLQAMRQGFADQLDAIKSNSALLIEAEDQSQSKRTESIATATANRKAIRADELRQVQALIDGIQAAYGHVKGADAVIDGMQRTKDGLARDVGKQNTSGDDQLSKMKLSMEASVNKAIEEAAQAHAAKMIEIDKEMVRQGQLTHLEAAHNEQRIQTEAFAEKRTALEAQLKDADQNEPARQAAQLALAKFNEQWKTTVQGYSRQNDDANNADTAAAFKSQMDVLKQREEFAKSATTAADTGASKNQVVANNQKLLETLKEINHEQQLATAGYMAWVQAHNSNDSKLVQSLQDQLNASKDAGQKFSNQEVDDYNNAHWTQKIADSTSADGMSDAPWQAQLKASADKLAVVFSTLEQTTNGIVAAMKEGNVWAGAGAKQLGLQIQAPESYAYYLSIVKAQVEDIGSATTTKPAGVVPIKPKLKMTLSAEGIPPSQVIKVVANRHIEVSRVDYMLNTGATMVWEGVSVGGETIEIPINNNSVLKLWNTPRQDRNMNDHSGPAKIALTISVDGGTEEYILPVQMEFLMQNSTVYRKLVGSKTFHG